ncbi:MAG: asparaginase [Candidatus Doudnabacteria bacterium]|nr:asparaginase [Candidatus Doudnabacteria bacterium]
MKIFVLNTGGTLGMAGKPLRPVKSAAQLLKGIKIPKGLELTLEDFPEKEDSTNIPHVNRVRFAQRIAEVHDDHDAFLVLHGTDSLALTTSAFWMIFKQSLQKSVFVVGAQKAKNEAGSDVSMQIANTLRIAKCFHRKNIIGVYNVCIDDVWDGCRLKKRADSDTMAFHTPGRSPVAKAWPTINLGEGLRNRLRDPVLAIQGLRLDTRFERRVATFKVSVDDPPCVLMDQVEKRQLAGAILECRGAGNIPDRIFDQEEMPFSWIDALQRATVAGIHVGILSPFEDGRVNLERYELGKKAKDAGAISLESLTPDMADVKFRQAIALHPNDPGRIQEFISTNIVGELLPGEEDLE